ncbi:MAG: hypothetical protein EA401_09220, partial [Planctomycetota bacterium]
ELAWTRFFDDNAMIQASNGRSISHGYGAALPTVPTEWWFTKPFEVSHRTRQMVIWSAPWQSYEDFESAVAAPVDFSHLALDHKRTSSSFVLRFRPETNQFAHPEERVAFANPARDATVYRPPPDDHVTPQGTDARVIADGDTEIDMSFRNIRYSFAGGSSGGGDNRTMIWAALGLWGADRNGNGRFDRGPLPANQNIRAMEVGRYVFYDPVMWVPTR